MKFHIDVGTGTNDGSSGVVNLRKTLNASRADYLRAWDTNPADTDGRWTVTIDDLRQEDLKDGLTIRIRLSTSYDENLNTLNVNGFGNKVVYYRQNEPLKNHIPQYAEVLLTYRAAHQKTFNNVVYNIPGASTEDRVYNSTNYGKDGWVLDASYSDGNNYDRILNYYERRRAGQAITKYKLCMNDANGLLRPISIGDTVNNTKTANTIPLDPSRIIYYSGSDSVSAFSATPPSTLYEDLPIENIKYTINQDIAAFSDLYLIGTLNNDGLFVLDSTFYKIVTQPSSSSNSTLANNTFVKGKYYLYVGSTHGSANLLQLNPTHALYFCDDTNGKTIYPVAYNPVRAKTLAINKTAIDSNYNFEVNGDSKLGGAVDIGDDTSVNGDLTVDGDIYASGDAYVDGDVHASEFIGNLKTSNLIPIMSKTFTTKLYVSSSGENYYQTVFNITPDLYDAIWRVRYRLTFTVAGHNDYNAVYDCSMSGRSQTLYSYHCYNSLVNYPIYYHCLFRGASLSYPHEIGFRIASSYGDAAVQKTVKVDIIEAVNCTTAFFDDIKSYKNVAITNYARTDINATSNGLQETSDNDTTGRDYVHGAYGINGPDFRLAPSSIFGYDENQKAQGISLYQDGYTSSTTNMNTARIYNTAGFVWEKGLWYTNSGTNYAVNANLNFSPAEAFYAVDFRYTDNVYAHKTNVSELGMVARKPIYLRGTIGNNGLFYLSPMTANHNNTAYQKVWTQEVPTSDDDYVYWFVGYAYYNSSYEASGYQVDLTTENKLYWFHDGRFQEYLPHAVKADTVEWSGVNGHPTKLSDFTNDLSYVTKVSTGAGLTGGDITSTGTVKANLTSETKLTNAAADGTETSGRVYPVRLDKNGKLAVNVPWTDTKVTSAANHYAPSRDTNADKSASASGATAAWSIDVVKGITVQTDGKGHVTGVAVTSGKIPANPNTDITVKQTIKSDNINYKLLATTSASPTSGTAMEATYSANVYANPSTSSISAERHTLNLSGTDKAYITYNDTDKSIDFIFI